MASRVSRKVSGSCSHDPGPSATWSTKCSAAARWCLSRSARSRGRAPGRTTPVRRRCGGRMILREVPVSAARGRRHWRSAPVASPTSELVPARSRASGGTAGLRRGLRGARRRSLGGEAAILPPIPRWVWLSNVRWRPCLPWSKLPGRLLNPSELHSRKVHRDDRR